MKYDWDMRTHRASAQALVDAVTMVLETCEVRSLDRYRLESLRNKWVNRLASSASVANAPQTTAKDRKPQ